MKNVDVVAWSLENEVNGRWYRYRVLLYGKNLVIGSWFDWHGEDRFTYMTYNYESAAEARLEAVSFTEGLETDGGGFKVTPGHPVVCEVYTNGDGPFAFVTMVLPRGATDHNWGELWNTVTKYGIRMDQAYG